MASLSVGLLRKDDRQSRVLTGVAFGNERGRELRQVVGQSHESLVEREFAFRGNVHPKRRVGCVFANRLIVADEFRSDLVLAGAEGLRVEIEDERLGLADLLCRQCGRLLQFAVKENVELRNVGEHRGRDGEVERQFAARHHFIGLDREVEVARIIRAP